MITGQLSTAQQLYNPQCFLQYENSTEAPPMWNVSQELNNMAVTFYICCGKTCLFRSPLSLMETRLKLDPSCMHRTSKRAHGLT